MKNIVLTTDSGIDPINEENMICAQIIRNNTESFRDICEISPETIIWGLKHGDLYRTSSPIVSDYQDMFEKILKKGNDIVHLSMGSGISEGSVNSANLVADFLNEEYDNKVYVIDTLAGATAGTLIECIAMSYINQGDSTEEIVSKLNDIKTRIKTSFYVPNPEGFIRSGRNKSDLCVKDRALLISSKFAGKAGIKYRVDFNDQGNLYVKSLMRCNKSRGMLKLVKEIVNDETIEMYDKNFVTIGNILEKDIKMDEVVEYLAGFSYFKNIINKSINGVVAAYGSEDLCGISLLKKSK